MTKQGAEFIIAQTKGGSASSSSGSASASTGGSASTAADASGYTDADASASGSTGRTCSPARAAAAALGSVANKKLTYYARCRRILLISQRKYVGRESTETDI
jgi:hypothetical protein